MAYEDCYNNPKVIAANYAEYDKQAAQKLTPSQAELLKKIGSCESGFQMKPNSSGISSAYGIFQTLKVHNARAARLGGTRFDTVTQIAVAIELFKEQGTTPWNASKSCWGK